MTGNYQDLKYYPLTAQRWKDFEQLFGERGACGGCWCMWWRLKRSQFDKQKGAINKNAMQNIVYSGKVPGLLAYMENRSVGWCSVAPREDFPVLQRSRILKAVDDKKVWSVVCFYIEKEYRNQGISKHLLQAAIDYVKGSGGKIAEGYPVDPKKETMPAVFAFTGLFKAFKDVGFVEVARRSETRPIMRYYIKP